MPISYKIDILAELKATGYSTYRLRKEKLLGESTIQSLRIGAKFPSLDWPVSTILRQEAKGLLVVYQTESTLRHFGKATQYEAILKNLEFSDLKSVNWRCLSQGENGRFSLTKTGNELSRKLGLATRVLSASI